MSAHIISCSVHLPVKVLERQKDFAIIKCEWSGMIMKKKEGVNSYAGI